MRDSLEHSTAVPTDSTLRICVLLHLFLQFRASYAGDSIPGDVIENLMPASAHSCGTLEDRLKCIGHTHPVFHNDNCDRWDCDPLLSSGLPFSCCMGETTRSEVVEVLNDSVIVWVGDSTARRANIQFYNWMANTPFQDIPLHEALRYDLPSMVSVSDWIPSFKFATASGLGGHPSLPGGLRRTLFPQNDSDTVFPAAPPLYPPDLLHKRKVFVVCISTHSLLWYWHKSKHDAQQLITGQGKALKQLASAAVDVVRGLKNYKGVDPKRDIILFRLPIAQACKAHSGPSEHYANMCNVLGPGIDPINIFVERYQRTLVPLMQEAHPDVGLLDLLSWTWSENRVDRAACAYADDGGTHFGTDTARLAFVQQVLHAVRLLSVGRPGWESSSASITQSLCPARRHAQ